MAWMSLDQTVSKKDVLSFTKELPRNKATVSNDIPFSVLTESVSAYCEKLTDKCIRSDPFPEILKKAKVNTSF